MPDLPDPKSAGPLPGFTLIELLAVIAIVAVAAAIAVPASASARRRADNLLCLSQLRSLGQGIRLNALENGGEFPRSFHSAGAHGQANWAATTAPFLGITAEPGTAEWTAAVNKMFRCPSDRTRDPWMFSYGLNVFFELDPSGDDYAGSPATWRRPEAVPKPARTILLAESRPVAFGDHLMCHQWSSVTAARNALDSTRHGKTSNFLFVDGHAESLGMQATFDPPAGINLWNPSLAR
jgi:prepilin-type N-terminal cleavage/methylation domain-containing protein/prepilin-type processing-associated H-X9-DG protein